MCLQEYTSGSKYFVVLEGRQCGIFQSWRECETQISGYSDANFRKFTLLEEANACFNLYNSSRKRKREESDTGSEIQDNRSQSSEDDEDHEVASILLTLKDCQSTLAIPLQHKPNCRYKETKKPRDIYVAGTVLEGLGGETSPISTIGVFFDGIRKYNDISEIIYGIDNRIALDTYAITKAFLTIDNNEDVVIYSESKYCIDHLQSSVQSSYKGKYREVFNNLRAIISNRTGSTKFEWLTIDLNLKAHELARNAINKLK